MRVSTPKSLRIFDDQPVVAINETGGCSKIAAVGSIAESTRFRLVRPFSHDRLLIHEFEVARQLFRYAIAYVSGSGLFRPTPVVIIHPMDIPDGGLTDIEERVFREVSLSAGARDVYLWQGRPLSNVELSNGAYRDDA